MLEALHKQCYLCTKKKYLMIKCKCDYTFCSKCLRAHPCSFDYKTPNKIMLTKRIPSPDKKFGL